MAQPLSYPSFIAQTREFYRSSSYLLRADEGRDGNVNLVDSVKQGFNLLGEASHLIQGGFDSRNLSEAKHLISGARDFFKGLQHRDDQEGDHLQR